MTEYGPFSFQRVERAVELPKRSGISEADARRVLADAREKAQEQREYEPTTEVEAVAIPEQTDASVGESFIYAQLHVRGHKVNEIGTPLTFALRKSFERWLADHDAKVREQVARELSDTPTHDAEMDGWNNAIKRATATKRAKEAGLSRPRGIRGVWVDGFRMGLAHAAHIARNQGPALDEGESR